MSQIFQIACQTSDLSQVGYIISINNVTRALIGSSESLEDCDLRWN
ncbi:hypothetical protein RINTHM_15570 [Richelia intracellularis HM01]|nr:hypothetical protein RINTHM_15570 [Richelia intracellularis HM01]